jgi:hypothetical protein
MSEDTTGGLGEPNNHQDKNESDARKSDRELFGSGDARKGLEQVRLRLLDLTNRNRLLNFRHPRRASVRVIDELPDQLFGRLVDGETFVFKPVPKPTSADELAHQREVAKQLGPDVNPANIPSLTANEYAASLGLATSYEMPKAHGTKPHEEEDRHVDKYIQTLQFPGDLEKSLSAVRSAAQLAIEESGTNLLYLAFGFLEWKDTDDSPQSHLAPLLLLPTMLERGPVDRDTGTRTFKLAYSGEDLVPNLSLREKLVRDFGLELPELEEDMLPEAYFNKLNGLLRSNPSWRIRRYVTLSLFQFGKLLMYLDLAPDRWPRTEQISSHLVVRSFFDGVRTEGVSTAVEYPIDEMSDLISRAPIIFDADSSQHSALLDALDGKNLVIEGPPGTGKSQTITNLIAAALANGKTVLFVSEKLAALEVVRRRLDEAGLGIFCLELHSHRTQKRALLDDVERRAGKKGSFTAPFELDQKIEVLTALRDRLKHITELINQKFGKLDRTIHELLAAAVRYRQELTIPASELSEVSVGIPGEINLVRMAGVEQRLGALRKTFNAAHSRLDRIADHPWRGVCNVEIFGYDQEKILAALGKHIETTIQIDETVKTLVNLTNCDIEKSVSRLRWLVGIFDLFPKPSENVVFNVINDLSSETDVDLLREFCRRVDQYRPLCQHLSTFFENTSELTQADADHLAKILDEAEKLVSRDLPLSQFSKLAKLFDATVSLIKRAAQTTKRASEILDHGVPFSANGIRLLMNVMECISPAPAELLDLRSPEFDNEGFGKCLDEAKVAGPTCQDL